ncbi:MAG: hypothetical protein DMF78_13680 [Acidobacteria bacterium]|nr:MAG: hypothetical protein DMF78_13680 [Acidobacteriota bacterium]
MRIFSAHAQEPHAHARARRHLEHGVGPARRGHGGAGHARLEVPALDEGQGQVARGRVQAHGPQRLARAQARDAPRLLGLERAVTVDADLGQQRRLDRTEHHLETGGAGGRLHHHVRVLAGGVEQLDHVPHTLGVQRLAGLDLRRVGAQPRHLGGPGLHAHRGHRGRRRRPRQQGGEDERAHLIWRRRRRSKP